MSQDCRPSLFLHQSAPSEKINRLIYTVLLFGFHRDICNKKFPLRTLTQRCPAHRRLESQHFKITYYFLTTVSNYKKNCLLSRIYVQSYRGVGIQTFPGLKVVSKTIFFVITFIIDERIWSIKMRGSLSFVTENILKKSSWSAKLL